MSTRLAVIGDIHAHLPRLVDVLERVQEVGVEGILQVGDLGSNILGRGRGDRERVRRYLASVDLVLERLRAVAPTLWVPGNHDLRALERPGNVDGRVEELAGLRVWGIGGAGPDRYGFPYEWAEGEVRNRELPDCDVLLTHAPPRATPLDWVPHRPAHVGSAAIRELAERHRGLLVCGHIHESAGVLKINDCVCLNAGGLGEPYGAARVGFVEWGEGEVTRAWVEDLATERVVADWPTAPTPF